MMNVRCLIALGATSVLAAVAGAQPAASPNRADTRSPSQTGAAASGATAKSEPSPDSWGPQATGLYGKSRAEVRKEARAAARSGATAKGEASYGGLDKPAKDAPGK